MQLSFKMDCGDLIGSFDLKKRQIPFAMSKAINDLGKKAQFVVQYGMVTDIKLRREAYELKRIMISHFATSSECYLVIQIDPKAKNLIRLVKGEDHIEWFPYNGKDYQWIPNSQVFQNKIITTANPLHQFNLAIGFTGIGPRGGAQHNQGLQRTFAIDNPGGKPGDPQIWQRVASGARGSRQSRTRGTLLKKKIRNEASTNTRLLYTLVSRQKTPVKLLFYEPIHKTVHLNVADAMRAALEYTVSPRK